MWYKLKKKKKIGYELNFALCEFALQTQTKIFHNITQKWEYTELKMPCTSGQKNDYIYIHTYLILNEK